MPRRRPEPGTAVPAFPALPTTVTLQIFALLTPDERAQCAMVSRGWRAALEARELWECVDLGVLSRVPQRRRTPAALAALVRRAGQHLRSLDASDVERRVGGESEPLPVEALARFLAHSACRLQELTLVRDLVDAELSPQKVRMLLNAAPALQRATLAVTVNDAAAARSLLRREAPYERVRLLEILARVTPDVPLLLADSETQADLELFRVAYAPLASPEAMQACVTAILKRKVWRLGFSSCGLGPASAPALARLLREGSVTELGIYVETGPLLDQPAAELLAAALRDNRTLTSLKLGAVGLWLDADAAAALLSALVGHPTLRELGIWSNPVRHAVDEVEVASAGAAIAALVAANSPALEQLRFCACALGNAGLHPIFEALPRNTHLRLLDCCGSYESSWFAQDVVLPSVRGHASLRTLLCNDDAVMDEVSRQAAVRDGVPPKGRHDAFDKGWDAGAASWDEELGLPPLDNEAAWGRAADSSEGSEGE